jgi:pimeloyl-ACP methyl ester carboxylesterase
VRDGGFFRFWFDRALAHGVPVDGLRAALGNAIDRLERLPVTLIHGELCPLNLVVDRARVVAVDWEIAGLGPGVTDLVSLLCGWPASALQGLGTGALPSLWSRLPELQMPVTLLAGERDVKFTSLAREMASCILHATVTVVSGSGHAVHLERPGAVVDALLAG